MAQVIYNCKRCKVARRVAYPLKTSSGADVRIADGKYIRPGIWVTAIGGGKPTLYGGDVEFGLCPQCHRAMDYGTLVGKVDLSHKCDARCEGARGCTCECSCGGVNHGSIWAA